MTRGSAGLDPGGIARLAAMLRQHIGPRDPGAVALLTRGDDTHVEVVGLRDVATGAPMQRDTMVRIASMTKPVTALTALALVERGVLALDQPVDPWLPELADRRVLRAGMSGALDDVVPAARAITLRDLLSLQFGLGAIMAKPGTHSIQRALADAKIAPGLDGLDVTHDEYLARIGALPLMHQPGAGWLYHMGLEIAGILVARAAKRTLADVFDEHVLAPLAMHDTAFQVPAAKLERLATLYRPTSGGGAFEVVPGMGAEKLGRPPRFAAGGGQGGGLVSTVDDFAAFARRLLAGGSAVTAMTTDQVSPATKAAYPFFPGFWDTTGWGLGMAINTAPDGIAPAPGRFGWAGGFGTTFFVDPGTGLIAILLTQRQMTSPTPVPLMVDFERLAFGAVAA